jgi:hypothetical protein
MELSTLKTDSKLANNIVKSLSRGYKLTTDRDQLKFLLLAVYLLALGFKRESEEISTYIASGCEYDGNENTWNSIGHQILLLARARRLCGRAEESRLLARRVVDCDILSQGVAKADYLAELIEDYEEGVELLLAESPKWRCEGFVYMFIELNYCREFAEVTGFEPVEQVSDKTEKRMNKLLDLLNEHLK